MGHVEQVGEKLGRGCAQFLKEGINESRGWPRRVTRLGHGPKKDVKDFSRSSAP